ncbi:MAG: Immunoglobulin I-set domain protein, partial [Verrucomicrobiales bacterium]|nr:Immunoglobulin I-set domain protein [Verrucomicrobiales bacterium]
DNVLIPGATANQLILTNVQFTDAATYVGTASSNAGSTNTSNAVLTVVQLQTSSPTLNSDGSFQLTIDGAPGAGYVVEGSSNLIDWLTLSVVTNDSGAYQFTDGSATNYPQFFYRVSAPK